MSETPSVRHVGVQPYASATQLLFEVILVSVSDICIQQHVKHQACVHHE
jgi:hypothetical protein